MGRDKLIAELNAAFDPLVDSVAGLTEEQMNKVWYGEWSVNQILSHISGWHREMVKAFYRVARGERPVPEDIDYSNFDTWNHGFAAGASDKNPAEALAELKASQESFVVAAPTIPEEKFEDGRAAYRIFRLTGIEQYPDHEPAIREWRKAQRI